MALFKVKPQCKPKNINSYEYLNIHILTSNLHSILGSESCIYLNYKFNKALEATNILPIKQTT